MDPASAGLTLVATVDLCLKYGRVLMTKYNTYNSASQDIREVLLQVQGQWLKIESQATFLRSIWHTLDDNLQVHQLSVLSVLHGKIQEALVAIDSLAPLTERPGSGSAGRIKNMFRKVSYALTVQDCVRKAIAELESWQRMFDPSWLLILRMPQQEIDKRLESAGAERQDSDTLTELKQLRAILQGPVIVPVNLFMTQNDLLPDRFPIKYSTCSVSRTIADSRPVLIDDLPTHNGDEKKIHDLARVMNQLSDGEFGVLRCHGILRNEVHPSDPTQQFLIPQYTQRFVFCLPDASSQPSTLRSLLLDEQHRHSLNDRLNLALTYARAVLFMHSMHFVHKNIRPETAIIVQEPSSSLSSLGSLYLTDFEKFRVANGNTLMVGETAWERNLYQHPTRQGMHPEEDYKMQHDIYSLGVCLLEIGLWTSFVGYEDDKPHLGPLLMPHALLEVKDVRQRALRTRSRLTELAREELPRKMGGRYIDIVLACLGCLDKKDSAFGDERELDVNGDDGIAVGVRYIERILLRLQEITI